MRLARTAAVAALLLAAAALAGVGLPDAAQGQEGEPESRTITATGIGFVTTVPDRAHFSFGVHVQARTASQALEASEGQLRRVVAAIRAAGVVAADIQTEQVSLMPRSSEDGSDIVGYTASSSVSVRVRDIGRAGGIVDAAVGAGANQVAGPSLTRSDQEAVYRSALREAYADARAKAQALAAAAGMTLGAATAIVEGGGAMPMPAGDRAAEATAIEPGTQELQAAVTVTFTLA